MVTGDLLFVSNIRVESTVVTVAITSCVSISEFPLPRDEAAAAITSYWRSTKYRSFVNRL